MPKRTKTEPKPTPRERPSPTPPDTLVTSRGELPPMAFPGRKMTIEQDGPVSFQFATCPICGSRQVTEVCPVDGHRFEAA